MNLLRITAIIRLGGNEEEKYARRPNDQLFLDLDGRSPHGGGRKQLRSTYELSYPIYIDTKATLSKTRAIQVEERRRRGGRRRRKREDDVGGRRVVETRERVRERERESKRERRMKI